MDQNRVSGGGVTASIDFGLVLLAQMRGDEAAKMVQLMIEYDPPPFKCGTPAAAGPELTGMTVKRIHEANLMLDRAVAAARQRLALAA